MHSAIFLFIGLLVIGSLSIVQSELDATELFREMLLGRRHQSWNAQYGQRRNYAPDADFLDLFKRVLRLDNEGELHEALAALFNINSQSGWVLLNYIGPSTIHFSAGGEGGVEEVKPHLEDNQIQYGLVRLGDVRDPATNKIGTRDIFICWIGSRVGIIEKGKKMALLGDAQSLLRPFAAYVTVLNKNHFDRQTLLAKSDPHSGSRVID